MYVSFLGTFESGGTRSSMENLALAINADRQSGLSRVPSPSEFAPLDTLDPPRRSPWNSFHGQQLDARMHIAAARP